MLDGARRMIPYHQAIREALEEEMERDSRVFLLGEDIGRMGGTFWATRGLLAKFGPERVRDTPISEAAIMGAAVGAAVMGMRPVAEIMYIDFLLISADQLINQAAKFRYMHGGPLTVPLVVRTQGGTGRSNGAQHSGSLEALFAHIPGLIVVMPPLMRRAFSSRLSAIRIPWCSSSTSGCISPADRFPRANPSSRWARRMSNAAGGMSR